MTVIYQPDHATSMKGLLYEQDRDKPRLMALIGALGAAFQLAEDVLHGIRENSRLPYAQGAALDQWGDLVGEPRLGLDDGDYRRVISARILANNSDSSMTAIAAVLALLVEPLEIRGYELYPSLLVLQVRRDTLLAEPMLSRVRRLMTRIKPPGRAMEIVEGVEGAFGFSGTSPSSTPWSVPAGYSVGPYARMVYP